MPPVKSFGERIADALIEDGLLTTKQVEELLEKQKKEGTRFIKLVTDKSYVSEQDLTVSMGRVLNVPPINLQRVTIPPEVGELIPRELANNHKIVPIARLENKLFIAMADPLNVLAVDDVKRVTKLEVATMIASEKAILDKLSSLDAAKSGSMEDIINDAQKKGSEDDANTLEQVKEQMDEVNLDQLAASSEEAPVIKLANIILVQAVKDRASDIHIEPFEKGMRLRYRIDGMMHEMKSPPKRLQAAIISRLKIQSNMSISEHRIPQDGRIQTNVGGKLIDLRVSCLPTNHGESIVMRILDKEGLRLGLAELGFLSDDQQTFEKLIGLPDGILLVTINREKALNALNRQTMDELGRFFGEDLPSRKGVKGVILTGA